MTTAVVDSPESEQAQAWWFLDTLVVEHRCAPEMNTIVLEMTLPARVCTPAARTRRPRRHLVHPGWRDGCPLR